MARKVLVGMLLLGAMIIFALSTFYIENWQFSVLAKGYLLTARFERALTLAVGDTVRISGVEVGRVHRITVDTETDSPRPVQVDMWILEDAKIRAKDVARIEIRSVFGGSYVTIQRGDPTAPVLADGDEIRNTATAASITDVVTQAHEMLGEAGEALAEATEGLGNLAAVTERLEQGEGTLGRLLTDEETYNELRESLRTAREAFDSIERFTAELKQGEGLLARLLNDEQLSGDAAQFFGDAAAVAQDLKSVTTELREGEGLLARLLRDEQLAADAEGFLRDAAGAAGDLKSVTASLSEGKGAAGRLLNDEQMGADLQEAINNMKAFSEMLAQLSEDFDESSLGKLARDDELHRKLTETLDRMQETIADLSEGEGTIGKLLKDDKLYQQLSTAMDSIQGLLDDYREQSPVLTFAGAVFGAL